MLSPLEGKRRGRREDGGGLRLQPLDAVTRQLQKHAAVPPAQSPGLPTAVAAGAKFVAIGTDRGLVLLFDHFQVPREREFVGAI